MMGHRGKMKGGEEYDCFCRPWRRLIVAFGHAGHTRSIKARYSRRQRREARRELAEMNNK